jgi:hypothetical protein
MVILCWACKGILYSLYKQSFNIETEKKQFKLQNINTTIWRMQILLLKFIYKKIAHKIILYYQSDLAQIKVK